MLGKYKLNEIYFEDSYKAIKNIPDKSIDLIYVDIPYKMTNYNKHNNKAGVGVTAEVYKSLKKMINGIDYSIYKDFLRIMRKVNIFIWLSYEQLIYSLNYFYNRGYLTKILFWGKDNAMPLANNMWLADVEYCLHVKEKGLKLNAGYKHKKTFYISATNQTDKALFDHPTIKPLEFVKQHILHTTQENDIVADFFLGSGTTAVACKRNNRRYIGFENDVNYYKIAKDRLIGITQREREIRDAGQLRLF